MRVESRILLLLAGAFSRGHEGGRRSRSGIPRQAKMAGSFFSTLTSESFLMRT